MTLIQGRNGRVYKDGKRVEGVAHPETRTKEELRAARAAATPKQPSGIVTTDPYAATLTAETRRKGKYWRDSEAGQRFAADMTAKSEAWQAEQEHTRQANEFAASIADLVGHASAQYETVMSDPTATVEDCERAAGALEAARRGERDTYIAWEKQRHEQVTAALATEAADYDSQARAAVEKRNAVLASALEPTTVPVIKRPEPVMDIPIDRSRVAITRRVQTEHGTREVTEIVDAE